MFGIGSGEMLVFAVVVLIALGPKRLPDFMRTVGKGLREIRKATTDLRKHSGIDELMRDDPAGLRALSRDISRDPAPRREQKLSAHDLAKESPVEGVDIAHAHYLAKKNAAAAAKEAAVVRNAQEQERVSVGATFAIEPTPGTAETSSAPTGFEGDTVPDKAAVSPKIRHEPTMLGIPAADPYALPAKKPAAPKASAPPPPPRSAAAKSVRPSAPPSSRPSAPPSVRPSAPPSVRPSAPPSPSARPSAPPPPVPAALRSAPPPPPAIGPSRVLDGKRASLPPSPSLTPSVPPPAEKPNARESTMAIEVEDLTLDDET